MIHAGVIQSCNEQDFPQLGCRPRLVAPSISAQSNGMAEAFRQNLQTLLRAGQCEARRGQRAVPARYLVRALQPRATAQGAGLPPAARVRNQILEAATEDAVDAVRGPHGST